jgi:hypothetical protein
MGGMIAQLPRALKWYGGALPRQRIPVIMAGL